MIQLQQHIQPMVSYQLASNIDPTRTLTIRTKFVGAMRNRFAQLMAVIRHAVIELDVLALNKPIVNTNPCHVPAGSPAGGQFCPSGGGYHLSADDVFDKYVKENDIKNIAFHRPVFDNKIKDIIKNDKGLNALNSIAKKFKNHQTISLATIDSKIDVTSALNKLDFIRSSYGSSLYSVTAGLNSIQVSGKELGKGVQTEALKVFSIREGLNFHSNSSFILNALPVSGLTSQQFDFPSSDQKIEAFVNWMGGQNQKYILSGGTSGIRTMGNLLPEATEARNSWITTYLDSAYQQGIRRARSEMQKLGIPVDDGTYPGSTSDPIQAAFNNPMNADRIGMIYTRAYSSLKGITDAMDSTVSDVLALGMADGRGPREIARLLNKAITGSGTGEDLGILDSLGRYIPAQRRAETLARTEVIRAHHQANMAEYRAAGLLGVKVQAEFLTAGDARVCPECSNKNGKIMSLDEAENLIPIHPQCRCVALPYIEPDTGE